MFNIRQETRANLARLETVNDITVAALRGYIAQHAPADDLEAMTTLVDIMVENFQTVAGVARSRLGGDQS